MSATCICLLPVYVCYLHLSAPCICLLPICYLYHAATCAGVWRMTGCRTSCVPPSAALCSTCTWTGTHRRRSNLFSTPGSGESILYARIWYNYVRQALVSQYSTPGCGESILYARIWYNTVRQALVSQYSTPGSGKLIKYARLW